MYKTRTSKRLIRLLSVYFLIAVLAVTSFAGMTPLTAYADTTTRYLAFTSDVHDNTEDLEIWLEHLSNVPEYVIFGGDYSYTGATTAADCAGIVAGIYSGAGCVLARGNHDTGSGYDEGLEVSNDDYAIYALDSTNGILEGAFTSDDRDNLKSALESIDSSIPVFVVAHHPIHYYGGRTTQNASAMIDLLNDYSNVIYLWGHNHSVNDVNYGTVKFAGDELQYTGSSSDKKVINFTYANLGCIYKSSSQDIKNANGLLAKITNDGSDTEVDFFYKDLNGNTVFTYPENNSSAVRTYELAASVENGAAYVIVARGTGDVALTNESYSTGGTDYLAGQVVTVSGSSVVADGVTDGMLWTFTTDGNGYNVKDEDSGKYLTRPTSGGGPAGLFTSSTDEGASYTDWIFDSEDHNLYVFSSGSSSEYNLYQAADGSSYYFSNSKTTNGNIYLYKMTEVDAETYEVIYDGNGSTGGSVPVDGKGYEEGDTVTVLGNTGSLRWSGHAFDGWNTAADGSGTDYAAGDTFSIGAADVTLYAQWKEVSTVTAYELADSVENGAAYVIVARGAGDVALTNKSYSTGGTDYLAGQVVTVSGSSVVADGVTDGMLWTFTTDGNGYNVKDGDSGKYLTRPTSGGGPAGLFTSSTDEGASYTDWIFDSEDHNLYVYSSGSSSEYNLYQAADGIPYYFSNSKTVDGNIYLYKLTENIVEDTYRVDYDGNGSTEGSVPVDDESYREGDTVIILENTGNLKRSGYTFDGWNTAADGSGDAYEAGNTFEMGTDDVTLYAQWKKVSTGKTYEPVYAIEDDAVYVIVSIGDNSVALTNQTYSAAGNDYLEGKTVRVSGIYLVADDVTDNMMWKFTEAGSGYDVMSGNSFLTRPSGGGPGLYLDAEENDPAFTNWVFDGAAHNLYVIGSDGTAVYHLYQDSGSSPYYFSNTSDASKGGTIYLYKLKAADAETYRVTYSGNGSTGGSVPVDNGSYEKGDPVTVLGNTGSLRRSGRSFTGWNTAADGSGTGYTAGDTFDMGMADVTLYAQWKKKHKHSSSTTLEDEEIPGGEIPFKDIDGHWAQDSITWAWQKGFMEGVSKSVFDPDGSVTRAMFVTAMYRLSDETASRITVAFNDVPEGQWYTDAVAWASEKGIVMGYGDGNFGVSDRITREQMAMMIYRYMQKYGTEPTVVSMTGPGYGDAAQISAWALDGISYSYEARLMTGRNGNLFEPQGRATRAEMAVILERISEL